MRIPVAPSVYSDDLVSSTELNRTSGSILDRASKRPVTITRGNESFALIRRDLMAGYIASTNIYQKFSDLLLTCLTLTNGEKILGGHSFDWLNTFDGDELKELIREVSNWHQSHDGSEASLYDLDGIIHEWHESAIAISSPALNAAFDSEEEEVLIDPSCFLQNATESDIVA